MDRYLYAWSTDLLPAGLPKPLRTFSGQYGIALAYLMIYNSVFYVFYVLDMV